MIVDGISVNWEWAAAAPIPSGNGIRTRPHESRKMQASRPLRRRCLMFAAVSTAHHASIMNFGPTASRWAAIGLPYGDPQLRSVLSTSSKWAWIFFEAISNFAASVSALCLRRSSCCSRLISR